MRTLRDRFAVIAWIALIAALGTATPLVAGVDADADGYAEGLDCNDHNDQVWATPSEALQLRFSNRITLTWSSAADLGGTLGSARFDTLRSTSASNFAVAPPSSCADPQGLTTSLTDASNPPLGSVFFYLVRVTNACGDGTAGNRSNGTPRAALTCDCSALCSDGIACTRDFCVDGTCSHAPIPPAIEAEPQPVAVCAGSDSHYSIRASGQGTLHYQWKMNGTNVGSDSSSLTLASLSLASDGSSIACVVTDSCASSTSSTAPVTVFSSSTSCSGGGSGQEAPGGASDIQQPVRLGTRQDDDVANELLRNGGMGTGSVYLFSGEYYLETTDLVIKGRGFDFEWTRKYRSREDRLTGLGHNWDFAYNRFVAHDSPGSDLLVADGNSRRDSYQLGLTGCWTSPGFLRELCQQVDGTYVLTFPNKTTWKFAALDGSPAEGKIVEVRDRNHNTMTFAYTLGKLSGVTDTLGRAISVAYNADGYLSSITDFTGRQVQYGYYGALDSTGMPGDLKSVRSPVVTGTPNGNDFPGGQTTVYQYAVYQGREELNHNLLTITDPAGQVVLRNTYTTAQSPADPRFDRIDRQTFPNGSIAYVYVAETPSPGSDAVTRTVLRDRMGNVRETFFNSLNQAIEERAYTGRAPNPSVPTDDFSNRPVAPLRPADPAYYRRLLLPTPVGLLTGIVRPDLSSITNTYDSGNPDVRLRGNLLQRVQNPGPLGGDQPSITESWTYGSSFGDEPCVCRGCCGEGGGAAAQTGNKALPRTEVVKKMWASYTNGNGRTYSQDIDPVTGDRLHANAPVVTSGGLLQIITESWLYNSSGQVTAHVNPLYEQEETTYYTAGPQLGYLKDVTVNAAGPIPGAHLALKTTYQHDAAGNVTAITDPKGNTETFVYNQLDQLVRHVSKAPFHYQTDFCYDVDRNLVRSDVQNINEAGALEANAATTTVYRYDALRHLTQTVIDPDTVDIRTSYEYDSNDQLTLVRHPEAVNGNQPHDVTRTLHDERGLRYRVIDAEGDARVRTIEWDYDGNGAVETLREGLESGPRVTVTAHDGYGRVTSTTDPSGNVTQSHYDADGNLTSTQLLGELLEGESGANVPLLERALSYDEADRTIQTDEAFFDPTTGAPIGDGVATSRIFYDAASQVVRTEDDNGHGTDTAYDGAGRVASTQDAAGNSVAYGYDANGNVLTETETEVSDLPAPPTIYVTEHTFDNQDRLDSTTSPAGQLHTFRWNSRNERTVEIDAKGNETRTEYDAAGRIGALRKKMTDSGDGGGSLSYVLDATRSYDDDSRLVQESDDNGNATTYQYDPRGRVSATIRADGTAELMSYDVHDNLISWVDANGTVVTATFDPSNRLTARSIARAAGVLGTSSEVWKYDGRSHVVYAQNDDAVVTRKFDSLSNQTEETQKIGSGPVRSSTAAFDGAANRTHFYSDGDMDQIVDYDDLDRVSSIAASGPATCSGGATDGHFCASAADCSPGAGCTLAAPRVTSFAYAGPNRLVYRANANGTETSYAFDAARRMTGMTTARPSPYALLDSRSFTWDAMNNKASRTDSRLPGSDRVHNYTYDSAGRLTHSVTTAPALPPVVADYSIDGMCNRAAVTGGPDSGPYTLNNALPEPADLQVNQYTSTPLDGARAYDRNGNLLQRSATGESLSYDYRNQMVQSSGPLGTVLYKYDPFGRRVEADGKQYFFDDEEAVSERTLSGNLGAVYVYDRSGLEQREVVMAVGDYSGDGIPDLAVPHSDDLGNVVALSNASGTLLEAYDYDDFGRPRFYNPSGASLPESAIGNAILFKGMRFDKKTGLYLDGDRYLDPHAGSFTTREAIRMPGALEFPNAFADGNPWSSSRRAPAAEARRAGQGDAPTDGLLILRYLFGLRGPALITGAVGPSSSRAIQARSGEYISPGALSVDDNGSYDPLTDGLMLLRSMFGLRGAALIAGAVAPEKGGGDMQHKPLRTKLPGEDSASAKLCPGHISCPPTGAGSSFRAGNPVTLDPTWAGGGGPVGYRQYVYALQKVWLCECFPPIPQGYSPYCDSDANWKCNVDAFVY